MADDEGLSRADVQALAVTRQDLGPDYEPDLLEAFADRVERAVEVRIGAALEDARSEKRDQLASIHRHGTRQFILAVLSVVACIPLVLALALNDELPGLVVALLGLVAINAAHASAGPAKERP